MFEILKYIPTLTEKRSESRDKSQLIFFVSMWDIRRLTWVTWASAQVAINSLFQRWSLCPVNPRLRHPKSDILRSLRSLARCSGHLWLYPVLRSQKFSNVFSTRCWKR